MYYPNEGAADVFCCRYVLHVFFDFVELVKSSIHPTNYINY